MTSTHRLTHPLPSPSLPFTHSPCPVPVVGKEAGSDSMPLCVVLFPLNTLEGERLAWESGVGYYHWRNANICKWFLREVNSYEHNTHVLWLQREADGHAKESGVIEGLTDRSCDGSKGAGERAR